MEPISVAIGGIAGRAILFHNCYIAETLARLWRGEPVDTFRRIHNFYDAQSEDEGPGSAFQANCDAALNSGLPGPIYLEKDGLSPEQCESLDRLTDLAGRYREMMSSDEDMSLDRLQRRSICSAILVVRASRTDKLDLSFGCGPRNLVGRALNAMRRDATQLAERHLPWLENNFAYGTEILDVNISNPELPILTIKNRASQEISTTRCNLFIKATGMTWKLPVEGEVASHAFTGVAGYSDLRDYLSRNQLLDSEELVKPGSKILFGGASLSAIDQVGVLLAMTRIVRVDPSVEEGFIIDESEAKKHSGLATLFSRTQGEILPARFWERSPAPDGDESAGVTAEMIFSARLQKDMDQFSTYIRLARVLTALRCKKLPKDVDGQTTMSRRLAEMILEDEEYISKRKYMTDTFIFQRYLRSFFLSHGEEWESFDPESHPTIAREPWDTYRAMAYNATHPSDEQKIDDEEHFDASKLFIKHVSAVPTHLHLLITRLFDLGVVTWKQGSYSEVTFSSKEGLYKLGTDKFDALIASRVYTADADAIKEGMGELLSGPSPSEPIFSKGRFLRTPAKKAAHIMELGLVGQGTVSEKRHAHVQWKDTNSFSGAYQLGPVIAKTVAIFETVIGRQVPTPMDFMMKLYERTLPTCEDFRRQVEKFRAPFEQLVHFLHTAELLERTSLDGREFAARMRQVTGLNLNKGTGDQIRSVDDETKGDDEQSQPVASYFAPVDLSRFEAMFPDFSPTQLHSMRKTLDRESFGESGQIQKVIVA